MHIWTVRSQYTEEMSCTITQQGRREINCDGPVPFLHVTELEQLSYVVLCVAKILDNVKKGAIPYNS